MSFYISFNYSHHYTEEKPFLKPLRNSEFRGIIKNLMMILIYALLYKPDTAFII